ncbi:MAG: hypothetical protein ACI8P9_003015 [Parasphingorhabdus sp.]|jgi:uncharacterized protein YbaR (Trm112 family)
MPIESKLLEILRCPITKQHLQNISPDQLTLLNQKIHDGVVSHLDGSKVTKELDSALITQNRKTIYKIEDDIPIMLEDLSIDAELLN